MCKTYFRVRPSDVDTVSESRRNHLFYADLAPLPKALADHLWQRFARGKSGTQEEIRALFVSAVREKRHAAFSVLDSFVRTDSLTRTEVMDRLMVYGHVFPQPTYTFWRKRALDSGMSEPLFLMGLFITAMLNPRKPDDENGSDKDKLPTPRQYGFWPNIPDDDTWYCYVQRSPQSALEDWPSNRLAELPAHAVCWTEAASPYWEKDDGWSLIGDSPNFLGCMRFAGVRRNERGDLWYNIDKGDIARWDEEVADLAPSSERNTSTSIQDLCRPLFNRLAVTRLGTRS